MEALSSEKFKPSFKNYRRVANVTKVFAKRMLERVGKALKRM